MKKIKITIQPLSYLLNSAGKGRGLRDVDVCFNKEGFPIVHRKTFKGLLRESLQEVLEIQGEENTQQIIYDFFGQEGDGNQGRLYFENDFQLQGWQEISNDVARNPIAVNAVKEYFTHEISQTKIASDGVAEDHSLRTIAVLRPEVCFEATISIVELTDEEEKWLQRACQNLRFMGMQRNRGLGRVNVYMDDVEEDVEEDVEQDTSKDDDNKFQCPENHFLELKITTLSSILLTQLNSNLNTVYTENNIAGNKIRGVFASLYIQRKGKDYNPDKDEGFYQIFLSGKVQFGFGYFNNTTPLPRNWQQTKEDKDTLYNVFNEEDDEVNKSYKAASVLKVGGKFKKENLKKTLNFHNSRTNRTAGRSLEDEGSIYYYQTIDANQQFTANIHSEDSNLLTKLVQTTSENFEANIGKSKSTLGKVNIEVNTKEAPAQVTGTIFQLTVKSPLVLLNEYGFPQISKDILNKELKEIHSDFEIDTSKMALSNSEIDQYVSLWKAKTGIKLALAPGSTCILTSEKELELDIQYFLGVYNEQGYGEVIIEPYKETFVKAKFSEDSGGNPKPDEEQEFSNNWTEKIREQIAQRNNTVAIKTLAIQYANSYNANISNSFLTRLIHVFEKYSSTQEINQYVKRHEEKIFGESLKKAGFATESQNHIKFNFGYKNNPYVTSKFQELQLFWIEFLKTIRLINNTKK